jgi:Flp pilus assembly protein TadD
MDIRNRIKELKRSNDWFGIYEMFAPLENLPHSEVWEDAKVLSEIGFACGKLAAVAAHDIPKQEPEKRKFLQQKAKYRDEAERLHKKCLELVPNNVTYLANLAYLHYQSSLELKQPKGRRDGNRYNEAEEAIKYYNQLLAIDPNRIKDLYRRGYLLIEILSDYYSLGKNSALAKQNRLNGIQSFQKAIQVWESLDSTNQEQKAERNRCRNEYIKSLYNAGSAHYEMIINKWDAAIFALGLRKNVNREDNVTYSPKDLENAKNAWRYFYKCWEVDRQDATSKGTINGVCEGVDKLYSLGKVAFAQYWILSGNGQKKDEDASEAIKYRDKAEQYLNDALEFHWSQNKQQQKKDYIAERLARLYISKEDYEKAIKVINQYRTSRLEPYLLHTLALALMLSKKHGEAQIKLQEAVKNRQNRDIYTSHFLIGCSLLREARLEEANQEFQKIRENKETDTLLFGQALVAYKSNQKEAAKEIIAQANKKNPFRISIGKYLDKWSEGRIRPLKPTQTQP